MRSSIGLVFALGTCLSFAFGAAPDKLDGFTYYERGVYQGAFITFEDSASVFAPDGTFSQIYARFNPGTRDAVNASLTQPSSGRYSYRKIDDLTAELRFIDASSFSHAGFLRFTSDQTDSGVFDDPSIVDTPGVFPQGVRSRTFRLVAPSARGPLVNSSNRSFVRTGGSSFAGFVISGTINRMVLMRAVGPGLAQFGLNDFLPEPRIQGVVDAADDRVFSAGAECVRRTSAAVGAFPLAAGSRDFVMMRNLRPGAYSLQAFAANSNDAGEVLVEVYILP